MKKLFILLTALFSIQYARAQTNLLPQFIQRMYLGHDTSKKSSFLILPVFTSAPETGIEVGGAGLLSFYTDTSNRITRVSNVFGYATITTKGQNRLSLSTSYWLPQNKYHLTAAISYIRFPFDFFGIGNNTLLANEDHVNEKRYKFNFEADRLIIKNIYAGVVAGTFKYDESDANPTGIFNTSPAVQGRNGGASIFIGPSVIFDSRNNNTYTTKGIIVTSYFNLLQGILGNQNYTGGFFNVEYSQFISLSKSLVLGLDVQEQSMTGTQSPFYLLPSLGNDEMMRGYYNGRYRDRNFIAGQTELRFRVNQRLALVGFVGTGEVAHTMFSFPALKPDFGGGWRYFFDVQKGLSVRVDYGIGEKPPGEKRESGFYIGLGQAF